MYMLKLPKWDNMNLPKGDNINIHQHFFVLKGRGWMGYFGAPNLDGRHGSCLGVVLQYVHDGGTGGPGTGLGKTRSFSAFSSATLVVPCGVICWKQTNDEGSYSEPLF